MEDAFGRVQSVLLVGGTSDIGLAIVRRLPLQQCAAICLAGPHRTGLEATAGALRGAGFAHVRVVNFDASTVVGAPAVLAEAWINEPDVVIVAAGLLGDQSAAERDPALAMRIVDVNFRGLVPLLIDIAERLRAQGHGTLIVMSSVASQRPRRANYIYGAAKSGLDALSRGIAGSLEGTGARVLIVRPGFVRTSMTEHLAAAPLATTPDKVADAVVDALRSGRRVVWVPGGLRWLMAILRILPEAVFGRLPG